MLEEAFIRKLAKVEAAQPASRAVFQEIVAVEVPVRLMSDLLWALLRPDLTPEHHCDASLLPELRELALSIDESLAMMGGASPSELVRLVRSHALLTPPCPSPGASTSTLRAFRASPRASPQPDPTPSSLLTKNGDNVVSEQDSPEAGPGAACLDTAVLGDYVHCGALQTDRGGSNGDANSALAGATGRFSGGGWDREAVLWVPSHRREEGEFEVELLPPNVMLMLRSTAAFDLPRKSMPGAGYKSEGGSQRRREDKNGKGVGCRPSTGSCDLPQSPHRLMLFNDSVVVVSVQSTPDCNEHAPNSSEWDITPVQDLGAKRSAGKMSANVGAIACDRAVKEAKDPDITLEVSHEEQLFQFDAAAVGSVRPRAGAWLRRHGASCAQALVLQNADHRWWISEMQVADIEQVVSANVVASASLEYAVALQHVAEAVSSHKSALFDDSWRESDHRKRGASMQPRGSPSWVKFRNADDKTRFLSAVARLQASPHARDEDEGET